MSVEWEPVAEFSSHEEATLLAGRLEAEGVEARLDPPEQSTYYGAGTARILQYRYTVLVPVHMVREALVILRSLEPGRDD
ncbi:MAG TPA: hypothetical protein VEA19_04170 [Actinomycetota bacterium]|nr:hypothetical protein [Actinomycetota bacterium]